MGTQHLTPEAKARIHTLYYDAKLGPTAIANATGYSISQVKRSIRSGTTTVAPRSGRPRALNTQQEEELVEFVCASKENRRMGYLQLSRALFGMVFSLWAIKNALWRLGFRRRVARKKPPITETNWLKRLNWALEHLD
jgi:transposase